MFSCDQVFVSSTIWFDWASTEWANHSQGLCVLAKLFHCRIVMSSTYLPLTTKKFLQRILAQSSTEKTLYSRYSKKVFDQINKRFCYNTMQYNNELLILIRNKRHLLVIRNPLRVSELNSILFFSSSVNPSRLSTYVSHWSK